MPKRGRKVGAYALRQQYLHQTIDTLMDGEGLPSGIHTVRYGDMIGDLLYDERPDSNTLLVFFTAAANRHHTWPLFSGIGISDSVGASLLAFSDPSIALGTSVGTGWTLGDYRYPYHQEVPRIIRKVADDRKIILVGASAGGFPALHYGASIPDSISFVMNPRTHVLTPPTAVQYSAAKVYQSNDVEGIAAKIPLCPDMPQNTVVYLQNHADATYFSAHMVPYMQRLSHDSRVWTHLGYWGEGHVPMPKPEIVALIHALIHEPETALSSLDRFDGSDILLAQQANLNIRHHARPAPSS